MAARIRCALCAGPDTRWGKSDTAASTLDACRVGPAAVDIAGLTVGSPQDPKAFRINVLLC